MVKKVKYYQVKNAIFSPWIHRWPSDDWIWNEDIGVYQRETWGYAAKEEYCLGEFYAGATYGVTKEDKRWHGSYYFPTQQKYSPIQYVMNWNGGIQTDSYVDAINWCRNAKYPELKYYLWGKK